ncbi:D-alanyl-D-alanine carboxypeptidase [Pseudochrobactrum asaccharolyticum]|jgi:D-alanyl-D-alanine carboxypeptidase|uniref:D-alanyl-D-alanine carboxypeptidase n=2 Tax=Pseudochrobactrum asaccharolyticum TaxID=354351 RepID=A0A366E703_9HYPH|nr:D-alanyl-D-alanine carboxypeptidase [Pseudochrobactrum asaccharolyticum]
MKSGYLSIEYFALKGGHPMIPRILKQSVLAMTVSCLAVSQSMSAAEANPYMSVDVASGQVLAHNEAFKRWYPASLTKMMSAYVVFRALRSGQKTLESPVRMSVAATKEPPSKMGYKAGSVMTLDSALKIMMVKSANDVSVAVAESVGGSKAGFAKMMNAEAKRIGMFGSNFSNPHGLPDPNNYTTARDMALLAAQLRREFPEYAHYFNTEAIDPGEGKKVQANYNILLGRFNGADGMKTGFICASGFNLAGSATRNGRTIVAIVLGASRQEDRTVQAAELLQSGFSTRGGGGATLASLAPYGSNNNQVTDLRAQICSQEAMSDRWDGRDVEGRLKINSPYITAMTREPVAVPVGLIAKAPDVKAGNALHISQVPIPLQRPMRGNMTTAVN